MTPAFLGIDAGGTSTHAVLVLGDGTCVAHARRSGGNPTSRGRTDALNAIVEAAQDALGRASVTLGEPVAVNECVLAMAGEPDKIDTPVLARAVGLTAGSVHLASDVEAMYFSSACEPEGSVVVAGTGSVAARLSSGVLTQAAGGAGWLLGDGGSGFWIGRNVVRAVVAQLSGLGPATGMTPSVLEAFGVPGDAGAPARQKLEALVRSAYAQPPVHLARFAPIAFALADHDDAARHLLERAGEHLAVLVERFPGDGPLVLGGSVVTRGFLPRPGLSGALAAALHGRDVRTAENGGAGAAFLALTRSGPGLSVARRAAHRAGHRAAHARITSTLTDRPLP
ncbi:N-acetylglucosamine kinase [Kineosporia succinea]|uniref:N-acetylglucosamine kinase-like BadF-type ATPase n=1 Tax=Kineosporia succinea TaxID=84632 RepID=A0ABT9PBQ6_9ACTN|nr:BadF/BadG/BcrA/BcrD ATPase family protein [Kineosporia succinea]MDP9829829.1 N-acetylglucosamine kinase-like BadF-type ATPase [Kineosporia succinea]